jgi:hypothetical protein
LAWNRIEKGLKTSKLKPYSFPVSRLANRGRFKKKIYKNWQGHKPEKLVTCPCDSFHGREFEALKAVDCSTEISQSKHKSEWGKILSAQRWNF